MIRLLGSGLLGFLLLALWIYCIFDVIATDDALVRNMPKLLWLVVVAILPTIGSIAWLALGRPRFAGWRPGDTGTASGPRRVIGVEDRPDFPTSSNRARALEAWEADLAARERRLNKREDGGDAGGGALPPGS